ncbi:hypothetical protein [Promicromonospora iranensis]|uniref:Uncharacterized protein n=1 Tax=Promicromonospora iranensis TaxID=1105144 RepID=A0ABU2CIH5_9MICO|nr:hypothetical protein [Promicromonospora iranensis]MDR7381118.1 hypothetical protein [Promicromonospora iranensis]
MPWTMSCATALQRVYPAASGATSEGYIPDFGSDPQGPVEHFNNFVFNCLFPTMLENCKVHAASHHLSETAQNASTPEEVEVGTNVAALIFMGPEIATVGVGVLRVPRTAGGVSTALRAEANAADEVPTISIYRTPKAPNAADELAGGPNPLNHQDGDAAAYFGERSVAGDYVGRPGYADGMVRYDMHPGFLDEFSDVAYRYDWQGPGGAARIEWAIPVDRLGSFSEHTLNRGWVSGR